MEMKTGGPKTPMSEDLTQALYPLSPLPAAKRLGRGEPEDELTHRLAVGEWHWNTSLCTPSVT